METLPDQLEQVARVFVQKGGTVVQARRAINLIEGTNVTLTATDDATNERVSVTIDVSGLTESVQDVIGALGLGGSGLTYTYDDGANTAVLDVNVGTGIQVASDAVTIEPAYALLPALMLGGM